MQQKEQQRRQRQQPAVEEPQRQQIAAGAPGQKEQMRQQMAGQSDAAAVFQPQQPLGQQQRQLENRAIMPVAVLRQAAFPAQGVIQRVAGQLALHRLVGGDAIVAQSNNAGEGEHRQRQQQRPMPEQQGAGETIANYQLRIRNYELRITGRRPQVNYQLPTDNYQLGMGGRAAVIPAPYRHTRPPPSFPPPHRHSRESGNPHFRITVPTPIPSRPAPPSFRRRPESRAPVGPGVAVG